MIDLIKRRRIFFIFWLILVVNSLLRLRKYLSIDEAFVAMAPLGKMVMTNDQTPLSMWYISAWAGLFGNDEVSFQFCNLFSNSITLFLFYQIILQTKETLKFSDNFIWLNLVVLFSIPLYITGFRIFEIETILFTPIFMAVILFFVKKRQETTFVNFWIWVVLFNLLLGTKLPTALLFMLIIIAERFISAVLKKGFKAFAYYFLIFLFSFGSFLVWFYLYDFLSQRHFFSFVIQHNLPVLTAKVSLQHKLLQLVYSGRILFYWCCPFLFISLFLFSLKLIKNRQIDSLGFSLSVITLLTLIGVLYAKTTAANFPKYILPMLPIISLTLSFYFWDCKTTTNRFFYFFLGGGLFFYFYLLLNDPIKTQVILKSVSLSNIELDGLRHLIRQEVIKLLIVGLPLLLFLFIKKRVRLCNFLMLLFFIYNLSVLSRQIQADYSTLYNYGERGLEQTVDYLKQLPDKRVICTEKDMMWSISQPKSEFLALFDHHRYIVGLDKDDLLTLIKIKKIKYLAYRKFDLRNNFHYHELSPLIEQYFPEQIKIGDFIIRSDTK